MKKKKSIALVLTICCLFLLFSGCSANNFDCKISEIRDCVYIGVVDGYDVIAKGGERENDYAVDGKANKRSEFFIITLCGSFSTTPTYSMEIDGKKYEGSMKKHPFNDEYTCEINAHPHSQSVDITFKIGDSELKAQCSSVDQNNEYVSWETALNTAVKEVGITDDFAGEIFVRLIENPVKNDGQYFWYVAFCTSKDECSSVLINAVDGKVVAKKA